MRTYLRHHRAFGLVDVIFIIVIATLAAAVFLPVLTTAREAAKRSFCLDNLREIGQALALYANANEEYPSIGKGKITGNYILVTDNNGAFSGGTTCNANGYALLVYRGYANYKLFVCPSTTDAPQTPQKNPDQFGFDSITGSQVSYGFQPYNNATGTGTTSTPSGGAATPCYLGAAGQSNMTVIAGDKRLTANDVVSTNHGSVDKGQANFLTVRGEVKSEKWSSKPVTTPHAENSVTAWGSSDVDNPWDIDAAGASDSNCYFKSNE